MSAYQVKGQAALGTQMKLLIDTNILIPAEPTSTSDLSSLTPAALRLQNLAQQGKVAICVHPKQREDIARDKNAARRFLRTQLFGRYHELTNPPPIQPELEAVIGEAKPDSHDEVDDSLLAAVFAHAANYLVTEDKNIHRKAKRSNVSDRVVFLSDAIAIIEALFDRTPNPPPAVRPAYAYELDANDPIFESLRVDYPGFDGWLNKCKTEGRQCWIIEGVEGYSAFAIVNPEKSPPKGVSGKVLKICTFKVSSQAYGRRYGELLLKALFEFSRTNNYDQVFLSIFERHEELFQLLSAFGFIELPDKSELGEAVLRKEIKPPIDTILEGLEYNIAFGPHHVDWKRAAAVIPIQPRYHAILFPEQESQQQLFPGTLPFGNALRKAYLSNSRIKGLEIGTIIWFYRSQENTGIVACGVVEGWLRSRNADTIAQFVGKRTVYSFEEIEALADREILAIAFRQAILLDVPIRLLELKAAGVLKGAPQSIVRLGVAESEWLSKRIQ